MFSASAGTRAVDLGEFAISQRQMRQSVQFLTTAQRADQMLSTLINFAHHDRQPAEGEGYRTLVWSRRYSNCLQAGVWKELLIDHRRRVGVTEPDANLRIAH